MREFVYEYSNYSPDEFNVQSYKNLCEVLLKYAPDNESKRKMEGILYRGGFDDYSVNEYYDMMNHGSAHLEMQKRVGMAWLISRYPQTFDVIQKRRIYLKFGVVCKWI